MSKNNSHSPEKIAFEMLNSDENSVVFKRKISSKGRKPKELKRIEINLPTATLHYFSHEDFERLKQIEADIFSKYKNRKPSLNIFKILCTFLEIK